MTYKGKRVGVLVGGPSAEREVSLSSGRGVLFALQQKGYEAIAVDWRSLDEDLVALIHS